MSNRDLLITKIKNRQATIGVVGLGYVGLPLAVGFADKGFKVVGIEKDPLKVERINRGENYIGDVDSALLAKLCKDGLLTATLDFSALRKLDAVLICVPTPLGKTGDPDVSFIVDVRDECVKYLHSPQAVVLESTTYPGTLEELVQPTFAETGLVVGEDYFLAFSPERIDPNNPVYRVDNTPKVVGGMTPACTDVVCELYSQLMKVVRVSSPATAEMVKLLENTFRAINIGLANEVAIMCRILGLNVWEVIEAASTKPYGFMPFYPGPGLGGHCIPIDPSYLSWKLRALQYRTRFIELATEINTHMPEYVVNLAVDVLNGEKKAMNGSKALIIGVAYKKDIDDLRESPALDVIRLLEQKGMSVKFHDPHIAHYKHEGELVHGVTLTEQILKEQDLVMIVTDHSSIDYGFICEHAHLVLDTRNATKTIGNPKAKVVKL